MTRIERIREALAALQPVTLEVVDDSHRHAGHEGARDGRGHFTVRIVSPVFAGKAPLARHRAVFGGEHSAHYYFRDFWFADTGMLAAMHLLAALGEQDAPLSELMGDLSRYPASGEVNSTVADAAGATERVLAWGLEQGVEVERLDGLTLVHPGGDDDPMWWLNLRASNTEPLLRLNVEAEDAGTMARVRDHVLGIVRATP